MTKYRIVQTYKGYMVQYRLFLFWISLKDYSYDGEEVMYFQNLSDALVQLEDKKYKDNKQSEQARSRNHIVHEE